MGAHLTEKQFERECGYRTSISIMDSLLENGLITKQEYRQIERILAMEPIQSMRKRLCVAAYCRVSCGKDAMLHSLAAQVSYYSELIQHNPEWDYAGVYTDEAPSGTRDTRPEFQRLLNDCRTGKIDRILVKSISRFARNTVTLLETVRELKGLGVSVYFEEQKIDTLSGDGEFMLSILASFAQEESRSVSENCKWRVRKKFEQGMPTGFRMYGYEVRNGVFTIIQEEVAVVQRIFLMYLDGMGNMKITKTLIAEGIPAPEGGLWIIDRETFEAVQAEIARRKAIYTARGSKKAAEDYLPETEDKKLSDFPIGDRICCGICGKHYRRKITRMGTPYAAPVWMCSTFRYRGKAYQGFCFVSGIRKATVIITKAEFEENTADLLDRTGALCLAVLEEAGLSQKDVTDVLLVGGSTRMPQVSDYLRRLFNKHPLSHVNPDEAVALGAAIQSSKENEAYAALSVQVVGGKKTTDRTKSGLSSHVSVRAERKLSSFSMLTLKETTAHAMGVIAINDEGNHYYNEIIIPANHPRPVRAAKKFRFYTSPQATNELVIYVLQGDSENPLDCQITYKYVVTGIKHVNRGGKIGTVIRIQYSYDVNGVIHIQARQEDSKVRSRER